MFDEASDIQMHGKLNVFVNVCLHTGGEVKTLTLALQGETNIEHIKLMCVTLCHMPNYIIALNTYCRTRERRQ